MQKFKRFIFFVLPAIFLVTLVAFSSKIGQIFSSELDTASATLTNARLSFISALEGAQTSGSSLVTIDTSNYSSESVLQLQNRDTILINDDEYTVATTIDDSNDDTFNLSAALEADDITDDMRVIASQSSTLTVRFTTVSALNAGDFRILVPAVDATTAGHNGLPDVGGFDFGHSLNTEASITCPTVASYGTFTGTETDAESASESIDGVDYHVFTCSYTSTGAVGTVFDGSSEEAFIIEDLINPAPKTGGDNHTLGQADTYAVIIQHRDAGGTVVDQTTTKIGVVDAVKVSATIAPQLTFTVAGISSGTSVCGENTDVTTTAISVPFGALTIGSFVDAAQRLTVTTNAAGGYSVTVAENDQVGRNGNTCSGDGTSSNSCVQDTSASGASHTASADWTDAANDDGFGYSVDPVTAGLTAAFTYNESTRTFSAKQFADLAESEAPQTVYSRADVASSDVVDVCYRIAPAATNVAGDYENYIVYTASATF
jgi:hypothetical protein